MEVQRDPIARGAYQRWTISQSWVPEDQRQSCRWCGQAPGRLYGYAWVGDAEHPRRGYIGPHFCNFTCFKSYNS